MNRLLCVFVDNVEAAGFFWCVKGREESRYGNSTLAELAAIDHDRLVVLLAGEDVLVTSIPRPPGRESQSMRAVPFVLEERLAAEVDDLHVVGVPVDDDPDRLLVAALRRELIESVLSLFSGVGLVPDLVIPDFLALSRGDGELALAVTPDRFLALAADGTGTAMERENLPSWLRLRGANDQDGHHGGTVLYACGGAEVDPALFSGARVLDDPGPWQLVVAADLFPEHPLNLLAGDYRRRGRRGRSLSAAFMLPLVLAFAWLGLLFVNDAIDYLRLSRQAARTQAAMTALYKKTFPGPAVVINPRLQMEQKLKNFKGNGDRFLPLLAEIAPELLRASGFHLQRLQFNGRRLVLEMEVASLAEMDRLRSSIAARGGRKVSTGQIRKAGAGVRGELRIMVDGTDK